jgi:hypothetical protein
MEGPEAALGGGGGGTAAVPEVVPGGGGGAPPPEVGMGPIPPDPGWLLDCWKWSKAAIATPNNPIPIAALLEPISPLEEKRDPFFFFFFFFPKPPPRASDKSPWIMRSGLIKGPNLLHRYWDKRKTIPLIVSASTYRVKAR